VEDFNSEMIRLWSWKWNIK